MRYKKVDYLLFGVLVAAILVLSLMSLDNTCYWGDDWAAYITEGIAISEGRLDEQAALNVLLHPTELPDEALDGSLVYVWGYPLLMALVYKLVGFDRVAFSSIIYYKIPSAIALALLAGVMYLFLRRRFGKTLSFTLSFLFCACYEFRVFINTLYSDMVFLFFAMLSLFVLEVFLDEKRNNRRLALGFALGAALWYTYEVRLNGISIVFACAVACIAYLIRTRREKPQNFMLKKELALMLLPFAVFLVLKLVSEAILAPATGNTSDLAGVTFETFKNNLTGYYGCARQFVRYILDKPFINTLSELLTVITGNNYSTAIQSLCDTISELLTSIVFLLFAVGVVVNGFKRELHLTFYITVYVLVASMLPYCDGMRYVYPVIMLIPIYTGDTLLKAKEVLSRHINPKESLKRFSAIGGKLCSYCVCVLAFISFVRYAEYARLTGLFIHDFPEGYYGIFAYTDCSIDTYNYITENTPDDAVIGFIKPRALYLNTERMSLNPFVNGHSIDEVDYYLVTTQFDTEFDGQGFKQIFSNEELSLYERIE